MARMETHGSLEAQSLEGKLLIAMPGIGDDRFDKTLIYMCAHSEDGSMGIIVNRPSEDISFEEVIDRIEFDENEHKFDSKVKEDHISVHEGGPVEPARGFVLHTADYDTGEHTMPIDSEICLTATLEVLRDIATGKGPRKSLLALGYAGWSPGQLENEIQANGWLFCEADENLLFDVEYEEKYLSALTKLGIEPGNLASDFGHA